MPNGASSEKIAATKMTPRRPIISFRGSEIQPALVFVSSFAVYKRGEYLQETDGNIRHSINEANEPGVFGTEAFGLIRTTVRRKVGDTESFREAKVGAVGTGLWWYVLIRPNGKAHA